MFVRTCCLIVVAACLTQGCHSATRPEASGNGKSTGDSPPSGSLPDHAPQCEDGVLAVTGTPSARVLSLTGWALNEFSGGGCQAAVACRQRHRNSAGEADYLTNESRLVGARKNGVDYRVTIQSRYRAFIPCVGTQQIVLLKPSGEIIDRLQCQMTIKLGTGSMSTEVLQKAERDGAQLVVRYAGTPGRCPARAAKFQLGCTKCTISSFKERTTLFMRTITSCALTSRQIPTCRRGTGCAG